MHLLRCCLTLRGTGSFLGVALALIMSVQAAGPAGGEGKGGTGPIRLALVGGVQQSLAEKVRDYLSAQYRVPVEMTNATVSARADATSLVKRLIPIRAEKDLCLLALVHGEGAVYREVLDSKERVAALNVSSLRGPSETVGEGGEPLAVRAQKESMRLVARALGLPACVFPRCCLLETESYQALDAKGMNLCPSCHAKVLEALAGRHRTGVETRTTK